VDLALNAGINRLLDGTYAALLLGAIFQLIVEAHDVMFGVDDLSGSLQLIFWIALLPTFYVAYRYESLALASTRHKLNEWLVSRLSMFDFADNPQLIQEFNLADELHSATRIGRCRLVNSHLSVVRAKSYFVLKWTRALGMASYVAQASTPSTSHRRTSLWRL
jgi:hypothetical protein